MNLCITGGTGTLGHALVQRFLQFDHITRIAILSRDEQKQAAMAETFGQHAKLRFFLGDVRDHERLTQAFTGCDTVIHAAALKRVDSVAYNPMEVRKTNIQGSANVLSAAMATEIARVVMVSSDKACEPTNIYGVTKAAMEHEAVAFNALSVPRGLRVACVRYGNVLGSRGSVVHIWRKAAAEGKPLPLTSTQMTRFWLTVDTATSIIEDALERMRGGEIFVPRIPAMALTDLAEAISPAADLKITGLRPGGEKLHETLITTDEAPRTVSIHDGLMAVTPYLHPWRTQGWEGLRPPIASPFTSEFAEKLSVEEMHLMLKDLP